MRTEALRFFDAALPRTTGTATNGALDDEVYTLLPRFRDAENEEIRAAVDFQRALFDAGLAWVDGPAEYGGRGLGREHADAVAEVAAHFAVPSPGPLSVGLDIVRPAVMHAGDPDQKRRWLPGIVRGDLVCCQLFSEPEAGSDLAGLRTSARAEGDTWVVHGQKVWSSGAHFSDLGLLLARTGTRESRGRGLTLFLIEMDQPGVSVRPLRQMSGGAHFNEVFLDAATLPDENRIGAVGAGWPVTTVTLNNERSAAGPTAFSSVDRPTDRLLDLARREGRLAEPDVCTALAESHLREQLLRRTVERFAASPGDAASASVIKLIVGENLRRHVDAAQTVLGDRLVVDPGEPGTYAWSHLLLSAPAHRIAGGTDEIQRTILAERVLGLPREGRA